MPYTMSVITELLRIDIARRSFPHYADKDVVIQGHTIPKGKLATKSWISATATTKKIARIIIIKIIGVDYCYYCCLQLLLLHLLSLYYYCYFCKSIISQLETFLKLSGYEKNNI